MILKRLFQRSPPPERLCYEAIVAAARHRGLYAGCGVADSLDGRFDMITLHAFLVLDRLKGAEQPFRQALVDELFQDMDRSLREMGVGDLSVGKKVRKMAEVFYGRVAAYDRALAGPGDGLAAVLARNILPDDPSAADSLEAQRLAAYMGDQRAHLAGQATADIVSGKVKFREPSS
jgi:cytochrome b pre-mRNA-processing protein 3